MKLTLPYPPSTNRLWRSAPGGRHYMAPEAAAWKRHVAACWMATRGGLPQSADMAVTVQLHPKQTKAGKASTRRIDLDNALKGALDALNGLAWHDDKQVVELHAWIAEPLPDGGLTVEVSPR